MRGRHAAGYHAEVLGEAPELNAAQDDLLLYGILAMVVIFLLIQAALGERLALLVFLLLPMALAGAVLAAKIDTGILSLGSMVGFLTVLGIAVRNGIFMVATSGTSSARRECRSARSWCCRGPRTGSRRS